MTAATMSIEEKVGNAKKKIREAFEENWRKPRGEEIIQSLLTEEIISSGSWGFAPGFNPQAILIQYVQELEAEFSQRPSAASLPLITAPVQAA